MLYTALLEKFRWGLCIAFFICSIWFFVSLFRKKKRMVSLLFAIGFALAWVSGSEMANKELRSQLLSLDKVVFQENENVMVPAENYIVSALREVTGVNEIQAATEERDPGELLNKDHGYTTAVYFSYEGVNTLRSDADLIDIGSNAGGCIESFLSSNDAIARIELLSAGPFFPGYTKCIGTVLMHITPQIPFEAQIDLANRIGASLLSAGQSQNYEEFISKDAQTTEIKTIWNAYWGLISVVTIFISLIIVIVRLIKKKKDILIPSIYMVGGIVQFFVCLFAPPYNGNSLVLLSAVIIILCGACVTAIHHTKTKKIAQQKEKRIKTAIQRVNYLKRDAADKEREAFEASTIEDFVKLWDLMIDDLEQLKKYEGTFYQSIPSLDDSIQQKQADFQWKLRNAIEREELKHIQIIKKEYRNSKEHKVREYEYFCRNISRFQERFNDETKEFAEQAAKAVYSATGLLAPQNSIFPDVFSSGQKGYQEFDHSKLKNQVEDFDTMEGHQFEFWCAELLRKNGFRNVSVTQGSGDQGVDVLAEKDGIRYAIQCKCYSGNLGNKPIQEVHTGKDIYNCHVGVVMTNSHFTAGAIEAAKRTNTLLWDRSTILTMLEQTSTK